MDRREKARGIGKLRVVEMGGQADEGREPRLPKRASDH